MEKLPPTIKLAKRLATARTVAPPPITWDDLGSTGADKSGPLWEARRKSRITRWGDANTNEPMTPMSAERGSSFPTNRRLVRTHGEYAAGASAGVCRIARRAIPERE